MNKYRVFKLPADVLKETAQKHQVLRKQLKISQARLAEKSGVSLGSIKRFEQTGKISYESLLQLAHVLGRLADFERIFEQQEDWAKIEKLFSNKTRGK